MYTACIIKVIAYAGSDIDHLLQARRIVQPIPLNIPQSIDFSCSPFMVFHALFCGWIVAARDRITEAMHA